MNLVGCRMNAVRRAIRNLPPSGDEGDLMVGVSLVISAVAITLLLLETL